jgi:hypothetical protein
MPVYHLQRTKRLKEAGEVEQSIAYLEAWKHFEDKACLNHLVLIHTGSHMTLKKLIGNISQPLIYSYFFLLPIWRNRRINNNCTFIQCSVIL